MKLHFLPISILLFLSMLFVLLPEPSFAIISVPKVNMACFWILFTFLLVFLLATKSSKRSEAKKATGKLPPGPWKLPLIGNLHQLAAGGSLPHHSLRNLARRYGPLMHIQLGEISSIVVTSPEIAREILITNGIIFAQRAHVIAASFITYGSRDVVMAPYGTYWRQLRKICTTELLTAKRVQSFQSIREDEVSALVNVLASNEGSLVNLSEKIFSLTYAITSRAALGAKNKHQDAFISIVDELTKITAGFSLSDMYPSVKVLPVITGLQRKLERLLQKSDMITQAIIDKHREEMVEAVVKETLRLHPSLPLLFPRESRENCEISGYEIPLQIPDEAPSLSDLVALSPFVVISSLSAL